MHQLRQTSLIAALLVLLAGPASSQSGLLRGMVTDAEENPLTDVRVTITSEQLPSFRKTLTTNARGEFKHRFQVNQTQYQFELLFERSGFQSFSQPLMLSATGQIRQTFVMERSESQVVESLGDLESIVTGSTNAAIEAFNSGLTAQRTGDLATARSKFQEALEADDSLAPAHLALSQVLLDQQEYVAAIDSADSALQLLGNQVEALRVKYSALRGLGRLEESDLVAAALEQAEDAASTAVRFYNEGGEAFQAGDRPTALIKFRRAADLDPTLVDAQHAVATLELAAGNYEASATAAEAALSMGSEDVRTLRVLYDAYDALGRVEELTEIAPRLAAVDPEFGGAKLLEQAAGMWNNGETERAVMLSELALTIDPTQAKAHYFVGLNHLSEGNNAEARTALETFIQLAPDDPDAVTAKEMLSYIE